MFQSLYLFVCGAAILYFLPSLVERYRRKRFFQRIPTHALPHTDSRTQYRLLSDELMQSGYEKYSKNDLIFKVANAQGDWDLIMPPRYLREIKNVSPEILSWKEVIYDKLAIVHTGGPKRDAWSAKAIQFEITKRIKDIHPLILEEIDTYFGEEFIPLDNQWHSVNIYSSIVHCILKITSRIFLGEELAKDTELVQTIEHFTDTAWVAALEVKRYHPMLRRAVAFFSPSVTQLAKEKEVVRRKVGRVFVARQQARESLKEQLRDGFDWLLRAAPPEITANEFSDNLMQIMLAAIRTTAKTGAHILAQLVYRPEFIPELIRELENFPNLASPSEWRKMNSFMKESARLAPISPLIPVRRVLRSFTFSDGITIPVGTFISFPCLPVSHDPTIYPNPSIFDAFRFSTLRDRGPLDDKKWQFSNVSEESLVFGYGSQACPGRWFAEVELQLFIARLLQGFEVEWDGGREGGVEPRYVDGDIVPPKGIGMRVRRKSVEKRRKD